MPICFLYPPAARFETYESDQLARLGSGREGVESRKSHVPWLHGYIAAGQDVCLQKVSYGGARQLQPSLSCGGARCAMRSSCC